MIYGPRKTAEFLARAEVLRTEEKMTWRAIAKRIGVKYEWLCWHKPKLESVPTGPILTIPNLSETLAKVRAMREQKTPWKTIGETLGIDGLKLYRAARYYKQD